MRGLIEGYFLNSLRRFYSYVDFIPNRTSAKLFHTCYAFAHTQVLGYPAVHRHEEACEDTRRHELGGELQDVVV